MSFIFYFAVLLVAGATALFGLDLMTAPLPPGGPVQHFASTAPPPKLARREADSREEAAKQASADDRALTPVFPAAPGGNKEVRMVYPPTNDTAANATVTAKPAETTGSASTADTPAQSESAPQQQAAVAPQPQPAMQAPLPQAEAAPSKIEPASASAATSVTQPVAQQSAGRCDVSACAAAYRSFRASDCTYQPFDGPRQLCEKPPQHARQQMAERPRGLGRAAREAPQTRMDAELSAVAQRVRELTAAGGEDDGALGDRPARGRRVIVIERGYGGPDDAD